MAVELKFVDSIASSPTTRLNLNDGSTWRLQDGTEFTPPPLRRSVTQTLLTDGGSVRAAAYDNRTVKLVLMLQTASADAAATALQALSRELDRAGNLLKWAPHTTAPVFLRTLRSDFTSMEVIPDDTGGNHQVTVTLLAEPFALGLRETAGTFTVANDPAAATNPARFDITGVKGDVETPLVVTFTGTGTSGVAGRQTVLAVRRRGDPTALVHLMQAEDMIMGTDTSVTNSASSSGAGGANCAHVTFATTTALTTRVKDTFPVDGTAVADARGTYRVFARVRKPTSTDTITMRLGYGDAEATTIYFNDTITVPNQVGPFFVDMGLIPVPTGHDPGQFGYTGTDLKALLGVVLWQVGRSSGSNGLTLDYLLFVPADDRLCVIDWPAKDTTYCADGVHDAAYPLNTGLDTIRAAETSTSIVGGLPLISPGVTNRVYMIRDVTPGVLDAVTDTTPLTAYYWPRYLSVRPAST